jgi:hypothetical protein
MAHILININCKFWLKIVRFVFGGSQFPFWRLWAFFVFPPVAIPQRLNCDNGFGAFLRKNVN